MDTFEEPTTTAWRQFVLKLAFRLLDDENYTHDIIFDDDDGWPFGHMVFNGGIYMYDNQRHDEVMDEVYTEYFKPFLANLKIDEVDMYIYMRKEIEDEYGSCAVNNRLLLKTNMLATKCKEVLDDYQRDFQLAYTEEESSNGWVYFQALWRGHGCRWKNPFFTFKD